METDIFGRWTEERARHVFTRALLAEVLWEYGEEDHAHAVMQTSESEFFEIQTLDKWHMSNSPEHLSGRRVMHGRTMARAAIEFFENYTRDTARKRRRSRPKSEGFNAAWHAYANDGAPYPGETEVERGTDWRPPRLPKRTLKGSSLG